MALSYVYTTAGAAGVGGGSGTPATSVVSNTFDSTGYTHIAVAMKYEGGGAVAVTMSDNKSTTGWSNQTQITNANNDLNGFLSFATLTSPGSGHQLTFTFATARTWQACAAWLFNAPKGLDLLSYSYAQGSSALHNAGLLVNSANRSAVSVLFFGPYGGGTYTAGSDWTENQDGATFGVNGVSAGAFSRGPATTELIFPTATYTTNLAFVGVAAMFAESLSPTDGKPWRNHSGRGGYNTRRRYSFAPGGRIERPSLAEHMRYSA